MSILNECVKIVKQIQNSEKLNVSDLCQLLLVECSGRVNIPNMFDDILLHYSEEDNSYKSFLCECIPDAEKLVDNLETNGSEELNTYFPAMCTLFVWNFIKKHLGNENEKLKAILEVSKADDVPFDVESGVIPYPKAIDNNVWSELDAYLGNSNDMMTCLKSALWIYETIKSNIKPDVMSDAIDPLYASIISNTINDLMSVYEKLYADCYMNIPFGLLTSSGILYIDFKSSSGVIDEATQIYAIEYYKALKDSIGIDNSSFDEVPDNAKDFLSHLYYPLYHLFNICGVFKETSNTKVNSWGEAKKHIRAYLEKLFVKLFKSYEDTDYINFSVEVKKRLSDCVIVNEFSVNGMMEFTYHKTNSDSVPVFSSVVVPKMSKIIGKSTGEKISEPYLGSDVFKFLYVGDGDAYNKEVLFAYKVYERMISSGTPVNSSNIVLGKKLKDGMPYSVNLASPQQIFTTIMAGSGSGKGVLTLSILAGLFAAGHPVAYVDFKPDMSAMLWNMERTMNSNGANVRILAVDSATNMDKYGTVPVRNYKYGLGGEVFAANQELYDSLKLMPYLKMIQLSCVVAGLRASGTNIGTNKKCFFVMDEAEQCNNLYADMLKVLNDYKPPKAKKGEENPETPYDKAIQKMIRVFRDDILRGLRHCGNTSGRVGEVGYIYIGQSTDPNTWKSGTGGDWKYSLFGFPIGKTSLKLMGKGIGRNSIYAISKDKFDGDTRLNNLGYWAVSKTASSGSDKNTTAIKSYMVLNENDYGVKSGGFADSLLKNLDSVTQENVIRNDLTMGDGVTVRESAGFYGLMKMLCNGDEGRLSNAMGLMYEIIENILSYSGILKALGYSCVEEYLHSADPKSFFSIEEIIEAYKKGGIVIDSVVEDEVKLNSIYLKELEDLEKEREEARISDPNYNDSDYDRLKETIVKNHQNRISSLNESKEIEQAPKFQGNSFKIDGLDSQKPDAKFDINKPVNNSSYNPVSSGLTNSPNQRTAYNNVYDAPADIEVNPFAIWKSRESVLSGLNNINITSKQLLNTIAKAFGGLDRINDFAIVSDGILVINGVQFKPKFPDDMIQSMPVDVRNNVLDGKLADIFYLPHIYKFPNLATIDIENQEVASYRLRPELGIKDSRSFNKFGGFKLNKLPMLSSFVVLGKEILPPKMELSDEIPVNKSVDSTLDFSLRDKLASTYNVSPLSYAAKIWNKPIFKITRRALGYTIGTKLVVSACLAAGPIGILFGAFFVHSLYKYNKENKNVNSKSNVKSSGENKKL